MGKMNCWEFRNCGRERDGINENEQGVCPASTAGNLDGVHQGRNGGRACWKVAGTLCEGKVEGSFASKLSDCAACSFYKLVRMEEGSDFQDAGPRR
ncbi:MAG: two-CW domain-containing protein [Endomicrobiales bacterium]